MKVPPPKECNNDNTEMPETERLMFTPIEPVLQGDKDLVG